MSTYDGERLVRLTKLARRVYRNAGLSVQEHEVDEHGHVGYEVLGDNEDGLMVFVRSHPRALDALEAALKVLDEPDKPVASQADYDEEQRFTPISTMSISVQQLRDVGRRFGLVKIKGEGEDSLGLSTGITPEQLRESALRMGSSITTPKSAVDAAVEREEELAREKLIGAGVGKDTMLYTDGTRVSFHCECGGNVFRQVGLSVKPPLKWYRCNSCGEIYIGAVL